jgi:hypothetical protein
MFNTIDIDELEYIMNEIRKNKHPRSKRIQRFIMEVIDYINNVHNVDEY